MTSEIVKPCIKCGGTERYADGRCAACRRESARKYYAANPEKERERDRKRHAADPAKRRESSRKRREANPGVGSENAKKWRVANPERARESMRVANRKRNTGWTPEHESHAWEVQGGKCGLCGISLPSMQKATADHDHENGFARALLCKKCNLAEGMVKKSPEIVAQLCRRCNVLEGFATPEFVERLDRYWAHYRRDHTLLADRILLLAS